MTDTLRLTGQISITPDSTSEADLSGDFAVKIALGSTVTLLQKETQSLTLPEQPLEQPTDWQQVDLDAIGSINFVCVKSNVPSAVQISSDLGEDQVIPFDAMLILYTGTTAIWSLAVGCITDGDGGSAQVTIGRSGDVDLGAC